MKLIHDEIGMVNAIGFSLIIILMVIREVCEFDSNLINLIIPILIVVMSLVIVVLNVISLANKINIK